MLSNPHLQFTADQLVNFAILAISAMGLNVTFGVAGVMDFGYIMFVAVGAYIGGVVALGPSAPSEQLYYILGWNLPWPLGIAIGALAAMAFAGVVGLIALRRLESMYQAILMVCIWSIAIDLVGHTPKLFNGNIGIYNVPQPFASHINPIEYVWVFLPIAFAILAGVTVLMLRVERSAASRTLRAIRDDPELASTAGKPLFQFRLKALLLSGLVAGIAGALFCEYISAWNTSAWSIFEIIPFLAAIMVGGRGRVVGILCGAVVVRLVFAGVTFTPSVSGHPDITADMREVLIGALLMAALLFAPRGLLPERIWTKTKDLSMGPRFEPRAVPRGVTRAVARAPEPGPAEFEGPVLRVEGLRRTYGGVVAVDDCSFAFGSGITAMIGPNGAGKSTVVNLISGTVKADAGRIIFAGQDITNQAPHQRSRAGLVRTFQLARSFDSLSVLENVMVFAPTADDTMLGAIARRGRMRGLDRSTAEEAREVLQDFGLGEKCDDYAGNLSGGQRRLLELARAFMAKPRVLLLDEPTAGVSPTLIGQIKEKLLQFVDCGSSVLLIEHNLAFVEELCESAIVMADGRVLAVASMADHRDNIEVVDAYLGRGGVR